MRIETCGGVIKAQVMKGYGMLEPAQRGLASSRLILKQSIKDLKPGSGSLGAAISIFTGTAATRKSIPNGYPYLWRKIPEALTSIGPIKPCLGHLSEKFCQGPAPVTLRSGCHPLSLLIPFYKTHFKVIGLIIE